jgi:hypothetical protein
MTSMRDYLEQREKTLEARVAALELENEGLRNSLNVLGDVVGERLKITRQQEREACAVAAEQYAAPRDPSIRYASVDEIVEMIAADIRKRT